MAGGKPSFDIYRMQPFDNEEFEGWPWLSVHSPINIVPFYIQLDWVYCLEPRYGGGARERYITFFGFYRQLPPSRQWGS